MKLLEPQWNRKRRKIPRIPVANGVPKVQGWLAWSRRISQAKGRIIDRCRALCLALCTVGRRVDPPRRYFVANFGQERIYHASIRSNCQQLSGRLHSDHPADRHGHLLHCVYTLRTDPLFWGRDEEGLRQLLPARRKTTWRHQLLPGPDHRHRRPGRHRQYRRRLRCDPDRRPGSDLLDVDHCLSRYVHHLRRSCPCSEDPRSRC